MIFLQFDNVKAGNIKSSINSSSVRFAIKISKAYTTSSYTHELTQERNPTIVDSAVRGSLAIAIFMTTREDISELSNILICDFL